MSFRQIALFVLAVYRIAVDTSLAAPPVIGQSYADLTLPEITTGEPISLSAFRGQKVLLIQFASW